MATDDPDELMRPGILAAIPRSHMRHQTLWSTATVVLVAACAEPSTMPRNLHAGSAALAAKGGPPTTGMGVTATIYDADTVGSPLFTRSDDRSGQGFATYSSVNNVSSQINTAGGWQLLLLNQTARTIYLVLASQGIPVPDGYYSADVEVYIRCFDATMTRVSLLSIAPGTSNDNCTFGIDFASGRTKYKLAMGPDYPGTGHATVTCDAATNGSCTNWTIVTSTSAPNATVANLYQFGKNGSLILEGAYHNSFAIALAR